MGAGPRLGIVIGLLALTTGAVHLMPPVRDRGSAAALDGLPMALAGWRATDGIPERWLPIDPHEAVAVRRTYRDGERFAWVSVATFTRQDDATRRASINSIYPQQGVARVEPVPLALTFGGAYCCETAVPAVVIHGGDVPFLVAHWYQIGGRVYGDEYRFRLALMREILLFRRGDSILVRIAVPVMRTEDVSPSLAVVARLGPPLWAALADGGVREPQAPGSAVQ